MAIGVCIHDCFGADIGAAPGLFSMTNGWLSRSAETSQCRRAGKCRADLEGSKAGCDRWRGRARRDGRAAEASDEGVDGARLNKHGLIPWRGRQRPVGNPTSRLRATALEEGNSEFGNEPTTAVVVTS